MRLGTNILKNMALEFSLILCATIAVPAAEGQIHRIDLHSPEIMAIVAQHPYARIERDFEQTVLVIEVPANAAPGENDLLSIPLNLEKLGFSGHAVYGEADIALEKVTKSPVSYYGAKFMLPLISPQGEKSHPEFFGQFYGGKRPFRTGTHPWFHAAARVEIPAYAKKSALRLGLQKATGKVMYKNLRFTVCEPAPRSVLSLNADAVKKLRYTKDFPRLRGVMSRDTCGEVVEKDFADLAAMGGNAMRWQMNFRNLPHGRKITLREVREQGERHIEKFATVLQYAQKYKIHIVADLHPMGGNGCRQLLMATPEGRDYVVEFWTRFAGRFRGQPYLWGYDLMNEPHSECLPYGAPLPNAMFARIIKAVREVDPETPVIVEPDLFAKYSKLEFTELYDYPNVIYSVHMYFPHELTHQLDPGKAPFMGYPAPWKNWDLEHMRKELACVGAFQKLTGARVYIGEFSCIRWAPGADLHLRDCIKVFEENGWDWTYHAFREWDGWSVEHSDDPARREIVPMTKRKQALLDGFRLNRAR